MTCRNIADNLVFLLVAIVTFTEKNAAHVEDGSGYGGAGCPIRTPFGGVESRL